MFELRQNQTALFHSLTAFVLSALLGCASATGRTGQTGDDARIFDAIVVDNNVVIADTTIATDAATSDSGGGGGPASYTARTSPAAPAGSGGFGISVSLASDGSMMAVGDQSGGANNNGAVTVFERGTSAWTMVGAIAQPAGALRFGDQVKLSADGNVLVVGDYDGGGDQLGAVTVFGRNNNVWTAHAAIARPGESQEFGAAIALSNDGNTLAVGDLNGGGGMRGAVTVYARNNNSWMSQGSLVRPSASVHFGGSVALSADGNTLAVGDASFAPRGGVDIYVRSGNSWTHQQAIVAPSNGSRFGYAVVLSGDGNLLGAADNANGTQGLVSFFARTGNAWNAVSSPTPTAGSIDFGDAIALSRNGSVFAVRENRPENSMNRFFVSVYTRSGTTWSAPIAIARPSNATVFGAALSLSQDGGVLAVGDWQAGTGAVTVFTP